VTPASPPRLSPGGRYVCDSCDTRVEPEHAVTSRCPEYHGDDKLIALMDELAAKNGEPPAEEMLYHWQHMPRVTGCGYRRVLCGPLHPEDALEFFIAGLELSPGGRR